MNNRVASASLFLLCLASLFAANLIIWIFWDASFVSHDGVQYLSTAINFAEGRGFSTNVLLYDSHYLESVPAPQTVWPPAFPYLISLLINAGLSPQRAALLLVLLAHTGAAVCVVVILFRCGVASAYSLLAAVCFLLVACPWVYATNLLADPIMNFLILLVLALLPSVQRGMFSGSVLITWFVCAMLCTLLFLSRYSAILFIAALGGTALFTTGFFSGFKPGQIDTARIRYGFIQLIALLALPAAAFFALIMRNHNLTGSYLPINGIDIPQTLLQTIRQFADAFAGFLGFQDTLLPTPVNKLLFILIVVLILSTAALAIKLAKPASTDSRSEHKRSYLIMIATVIGIHSLLFTGYFVHKSMTASYPQLLPRYFFQIFGGLYVLFCVLVASAVQKRKLKQDSRSGRILVPLLILLFVTVQVGQLNTWTHFKRFGPRHEMISNVLASPLPNGQTLEDFIDNCYAGNAEGSTLWSNEGQLLHFYTSVPTLTLPAKNRMLESYDRQRLSRDIDIYDIKMLAILESGFRTDHIQPLDTLRSWFVDSGFSAFQVDTSAHDTDVRVDIYVVDEQCL